ncbi:MAG: flagellar hook-basal body protein [Candidatus Cloacimonetes bacterium]|nr:flagellar hook-basal body protein [Candidatus Cloacimonadota bacterium]
MIKGIYYSSSAMQYLDEKLDVIANNLANADTSGFKRSGVAFNQQLTAEQAKYRNQIDSSPLPEGTIKTYVENTQGPIKQTSNPFNFALDGTGYFTVQTPNGVAWTRDGAFTMNEEGYLTTLDGNYVMGDYGPIRAEGKKFSVSDQGDIIVDNIVVNKLLLQDFHKDSVVQKGGNLYFPKGDYMMFKDPDANIRQGYLESSNVSIVKEMIAMIAVNRQYQANDKAIKTQDDALGRAASQIAR